MTDRFNRASLLQNAVAPASGGGVKVALKDPGLAESVSGFGTLSKRLDAFASHAFTIGGKQAKAMGTLYGAKHAPTLEQLTTASETGGVIELPGDPTSLKIADQAAYAAGLSSIEDSTEIAGRRAMTQLMASAAADPTMTPKEFTAQLDIIVNEYSTTLGAVSPSSGRKVNASLAMVANSQVVSFSREYMAKAVKQLNNQALEDSNVLIDSAVSTIQGYQAGGDVTLLEQLKHTKKRIRSTLEKAPGINETRIASVLRRFDKRVTESKVAVLLDWARKGSYWNNPTGAAMELRKYDSPQRKSAKLPLHIKEIWQNTDVEGRQAIFEGLSKQASAMESFDAIETKRGKRTREEIILEAQVAFIKARRNNFDTKAMQKQVDTLQTLAADNWEDLQEIIDRGPITRKHSKQTDKKHLKDLAQMGILSYRAIKNAELNDDDEDKFFSDLETQRDEGVKSALTRVKEHPEFLNTPLEEVDDSELTNAQRRARTRYHKVGDIVRTKKYEFLQRLKKMIQEGQEIPIDMRFDADEVTNAAVETVVQDIENVERKGHQARLKTGLEVLRKVNDSLPEDAIPFSEDIAGLRALLKSQVSQSVFLIPTTKPRFGNMSVEKSNIEAAIKALKALEELDTQ